MKKIIMAISCLAMLVPVAAKTPDIKGNIVDQNGSPLEYANVILMSMPDSTFIQGTTSGKNGEFCITTPATKGLLKISSIGYETIYLSTDNFNGKIQLNEDSHMLGEVTISRTLPKTKLTGNSMITTIQGSVLEKSGTARDMLTKVPGVMEKDDNLEVLGRGTPIIYINGRKMQKKEELLRLRSEDIKEVEVITNPGAQYSATVTSVIRIKTIRRNGDGFGYDVSIADNSDLVYGYNDPSANIQMHYDSGALEVFGGANYWKWESVNESTPTQTSALSTGSDILLIDQKSWFRNDWRRQCVDWNVGFNWQPAENHYLGMRINRSELIKGGDKRDQQTSMTEHVMSNPSDLRKNENKAYQTTRVSSPFDWNGNAYYNGKAGKMGIDLNVDFMTSKTCDETEISDHRGTSINDMKSVNPLSASLIAGKLVLSYPVWKGQLQAGTEMTFTNRKESYSISGIDLTSSNSKLKEDNIAAFAEYAFNNSVLGSISAGVRYEYVDMNYTDKITPSSSLNRYTSDLFPSFSWARQFGAFQASLSYNYHTTRPDYWMMSEAINYLNPYSLQQGNSKLKDCKTKSFNANLRWKWINLYLAYNDTKDMLTQWSYIYNDKGVILIKNINMDTPVKEYDAFISASPSFGCFFPNWSVGMAKYDVRQTLADPRESTQEREIHYKDPLWIVQLSNTLRLKHSWQLECNFNYMSKGDAQSCNLTSSTSNLKFVVQKCWLKNDALCLRASISDVLQESGQNLRMDCGYYLLTQNTSRNQHRLEVSLRYSFNAGKNKYKGTGAGKEAAKRMSKE